jgi:hypothetical protein
VIKKIPDTIEQAHYVARLAKKLSIAEQVIFDALNKTVNNMSTKREKSKGKDPKAVLSPEEILAGLLIVAPEKSEQAFKKISADDLTDVLVKKIYSEINLWYNNDRKGQLEEVLKQKLGQNFQRAQLLMLETKETYQEISEHLINDLIENIKMHRSERIKQYYAEAIRQAESQNDREKLKALIKEYQDAIAK